MYSATKLSCNIGKMVLLIHSVIVAVLPSRITNTPTYMKIRLQYRRKRFSPCLVSYGIFRSAYWSRRTCRALHAPPALHTFSSIASLSGRHISSLHSTQGVVYVHSAISLVEFSNIPSCLNSMAEMTPGQKTPARDYPTPFCKIRKFPTWGSGSDDVRWLHNIDAFRRLIHSTHAINRPEWVVRHQTCATRTERSQQSQARADHYTHTLWKLWICQLHSARLKVSIPSLRPCLFAYQPSLTLYAIVLWIRSLASHRHFALWGGV